MEFEHTLDRLVPSLIESILTGVNKEHPNVLDREVSLKPNIYTSLSSPREFHPSFYGCYDWHSCVHSYWTLLTILETVSLPPLQGEEILSHISRSFGVDNLSKELETMALYPEEWEVPYGYAWLLLLMLSWKSHHSCPVDSFEILTQITDHARMRMTDWLTNLKCPNSCGLHANSFFSMSLLTRFAKLNNDRKLLQLLIEKIRTWFPTSQEMIFPSETTDTIGCDFLSPNLCLLSLLCELSLLATYFPLEASRVDLIQSLCLTLKPVEGDPETPGGSHLIGLNFCRSWCLLEIADHIHELSGNESSFSALYDRMLWLAQQHFEKSWPRCCSGHWMGDHWTATFMLYAVLKEREIKTREV